MENESPVCLHFIKLFRMTKFLSQKHGLPMPDYDELRKTYVQKYAGPVFLHNAKGRIWADRYYIAYQLEGIGKVKYVYVTKYHMREEAISYSQAAKGRGTKNMMPQDIKRAFNRILRIMHAKGTDIWVDEEEFRGMKTERWIKSRRCFLSEDADENSQ